MLPAWIGCLYREKPRERTCINTLRWHVLRLELEFELSIIAHAPRRVGGHGLVAYGSARDRYSDQLKPDASVLASLPPSSAHCRDWNFETRGRIGRMALVLLDCLAYGEPKLYKVFLVARALCLAQPLHVRPDHPLRPTRFR